MNSPRVVEQESKKAFRALFKKGDLPAAIQYLTNLKVCFVTLFYRFVYGYERKNRKFEILRGLVCFLGD